MSSTKKKLKISVLRRIFSFAKPYKHKFYFSIFLAVFLAIIAPIRPLLIQLTINKGMGKDAFGNFMQHAEGFIIQLTIIQIGILLIETFCRFIFTFITASLGQSVVKDLRISTYQKIVQLNLSVFDKTPIGTLTTRTINDIESVNDIFSDGLIPIIADMLAIISVLAYMLFVDARLTLICLIPFPFLIVATYFFKESVNKSFVSVRNAVASLNAFVQEHITGMGIVQAFASEEREQKKFNKINEQHRNAHIRSILAYSVFFPVVELVSAISIGLLVWSSGSKAGVSDTTAQNAGGIITSFMLCLNLLFRPLRVIADKFNVLQMGVIASERVFAILDNNEVADNTGNMVAAKLNGSITFNDVWFAYNNDKYVLNGISFNVQPGETLAIVGHTGSGKTSIISLLNRLYKVNKGQILIDDNNIEQYDLDFLRSNVGVVLQDVFLFSGSIVDNITLRNTNISQSAVIEACKLLGIHDFIEKLPGGYNYNVMERGSTLSLGQRQLLSFARVLLYNPSILILDEATSSIDTESELLIQVAIDKLINGRTSIVIAHRLSTIRKANKIMVLDNGNIIEMGTHTELMDKNNHYYQLHQLQFAKQFEKA